MKPSEAGENKQVDGPAPGATPQQSGSGAAKDPDELSASLLEVELPHAIEHDIATVLPSIFEQLAPAHKAELAGKPGADPANPANLLSEKMEELSSIHSVSPPSSPRAHGASLLSDFVPSAIHEPKWAQPAVSNAARLIPEGNLGASAALPRMEGDLPTAASITTRQTLGTGRTGDKAASSALALGERAAWLVVQEAPPPYLRGSLLLLAWSTGPRPRLSLGSDPNCDIVLASPGVSREHAEIGFDRERGQFFIADAKSTNGTFLQNVGESGMTQVVGQAELTDGCVIRFGPEQVRLVFRCYMGSQGT